MDCREEEGRSKKVRKCGAQMRGVGEHIEFMKTLNFHM